MANRKNIMDLAMVLDRVERITAYGGPNEAAEDRMWNALYRDVLSAIAQNKCADPIACANAALRPGTLIETEAG